MIEVVRADRIVLASRGSQLALRQAAIVGDRLRACQPAIEVQIATIATRGEGDSRPFRAIGGPGLFTSELERAVVEGLADAAVHSAKDLTAQLHPETAIVCIPERADVRDVFVGGGDGSGEERVMLLQEGAVVGTSSLRRRALLASMRHDLRVVELRGNVDTRLGKVSAEIDGAVLAAAGIERLGVAPSVSMGPFDPGSWVPAPGQGALAVQALRARNDLAELFSELNDDVAAAEVTAERSFAAAVEGGCSAPVGCLARVEGETLRAVGFMAVPDGSRIVRGSVSGPRRAAETLGRELAEKILAAGGREIVAEFRNIRPPVITGP